MIFKNIGTILLALCGVYHIIKSYFESNKGNYQLANYNTSSAILDTVLIIMIRIN